MAWKYEKYDEDFNVKRCPQHDSDGSITGKVIINLPEWFDENPEERIRLGWIKHYYYSWKELEKMYDQQTQYIRTKSSMIDEYTIQDEIVVLEKTEDMLAYEELYGATSTNGEFAFIL